MHTSTDSTPDLLRIAVTRSDDPSPAGAVKDLTDRGKAVGHVQLRNLNPLPNDLPEIFGRFKKILVPEMNNGQLVNVLRAMYLVPAEGLPKVTGKPFKIGEIAAAARAHLEAK